MKYTNKTKMSLPMALWLATETYGGSNDFNKKQISVTTLLRPLKQSILGFHTKVTEIDVLDVLASRKGTAVHDAIEKTLKQTNIYKTMLKLGYSEEEAASIRVNPSPEELRLNPNIVPLYSEIRTDKLVGDWTVSGEFDLVVDGEVQDVKNTKVYSYTKGNNDDKYIKQGSCYRWLNPTIITKDTMKIQFILDDWSSVMALNSKNYPPHQLTEKTFDLMSYHATDKFVRDKIADIEYYMQFDPDEVEDHLPPCTDEDLWRSESEYKYYSTVGAIRATKAGFDTLASAMLYMQNEKAGKGEVREIKGQVKGCLYCNGFARCKQKNQYLLDGTLILKEPV